MKDNFGDLINRDKCEDVFRDIKDHSERILISDTDWVRLKIRRFGCQTVLKKLRNIVKSGLVSGTHLIMTYIRIY